MIGQTISHYRITEELGEGGMGVVYKAEDTKLDRPVALKFLAPHLLRDDEARKRFEREAKAAARLDHPNICTVYEIDAAEGRTFIVMAFLEGRPLSAKIEEGPLKLPEALSVVIQTAEGLEAAHEKGITHRDESRGVGCFAGLVAGWALDCFPAAGGRSGFRITHPVDWRPRTQAD